MGKSRNLPPFFMNTLLLAGLIAVWIAFAPVKLGGKVSYALVNGISMEPNYHTGDLVLVRQAPLYQIGDIVTYYDAQINSNVIHRIIGVEGDHFIIKGDNNSWIDPYKPTFDEILGKLWIYLPKFGAAVLWVKLPVNMALAAGLIGGLFAVDLTKQKTNKKGRRKNKAGGSSIGTFQMGLYSFGLLALVFLGLSIYAFTRPVLRLADKIKYQQTGTFFYSASGTPGVYDTGAARSGEPVFTKLTCRLNLGFVYILAGNQMEGISGSQQFDAMVVDQQSGWGHTIPLTSITKFTGNSYTSKATLDLCQVQALVASIEQKTGFHLNNYNLVIAAHILVGGKISSQAFTDTFEPKLTLYFDDLHFYIARDSSIKDPMKTVQDGTLASTTMVNNTLSLLGATLPVGKTRTIALIGLLVSLGGLGGLGYYFTRISKRSPEAVILLKYSPLLLQVHDLQIETLAPFIEVTSIDDLAKLAERQDSMILHATCEQAHYYVVQAEGTAYRYVAAIDPAPDTDADQTGIAMTATEDLGPDAGQANIEMHAAEDENNDIT